MKTASMAGILLIVLGVIALAYQGITYTTQKRVLDIGPIHATKDERKTIPLPPILGGLALVGGVALLYGHSVTTGQIIKESEVQAPSVASDLIAQLENASPQLRS
jgi:uncharacterized membrane protein